MKLYPIFLNIENMLAVVVGGGEVAWRKIKDLAEAGARIKIIAPSISKEINEFAGNNRNMVEIIGREYNDGDINGADLVFSCTDNSELNKRIFTEARSKGIIINSVDDPENCTFLVPSSAKRGDLTVAVSTDGTSPAMAARLRRIFEDHIPHNMEEILDSLRDARKILQDNRNLSSGERGEILKKIVNRDRLLKKLVKSGKKRRMKEFLDSF